MPSEKSEMTRTFLQSLIVHDLQQDVAGMTREGAMERVAQERETYRRLRGEIRAGRLYASQALVEMALIFTARLHAEMEQNPELGFDDAAQRAINTTAEEQK